VDKLTKVKPRLICVCFTVFVSRLVDGLVGSDAR